MTPEEVKKEIVEWYCRLCPLDCEMGKDYICNSKVRLSEKLDAYRNAIVDSAPEFDGQMLPNRAICEMVNWRLEEWKKEMKEDGK